MSSLKYWEKRQAQQMLEYMQSARIQQTRYQSCTRRRPDIYPMSWTVFLRDINASTI